MDLTLFLFLNLISLVKEAWLMLVTNEEISETRLILLAEMVNLG